MAMPQIKVTILILIAFLFSACDKGGNSTNENDLLIALKRDTIEIEIRSPQLSKYETYGDLYEINNETYFAGYNRHMHQIDFFNLSKKEYIKSVKLAAKGPDKITIGKFRVLGDSTILCHQNSLGKLLLIQISNGEKKKSYNYRDNLERAGYYFRPRQLTKSHLLNFNKRCKSLLMYVKAYGKDVSQKYQFADSLENLFEGNFIAEYFPFKDSLEIINKKYPAFLRENNDFYGNLSVPFLLNKEHNIVCNYPAFSKVCVVNKLTKETQIFKAESQVIPNESKSIGWSSKTNLSAIMIHSSNASQFLQIHWDPYRKYYYRVFQKSSKTGEIPKFGLSIMDENFILQKEAVLPELFYKVYIGKNGIFYFPKKGGTNFTMIRLKPKKLRE